ncbi:peptide methionine sulfoxide reductase [Aquimarina sp. ERC-38]|uniref:peptide methionine sulfoxide reductase n=1 Tax=Aquimarina sp. ERC-38 TaxID=2949996 RepID=UPI002245C2F8|nr:peptide methionine sulfoxide reductase [Aquimarina sp. ERC-38]UZO79933.1 peptide methionine sulfoxide reductase [Aquimarina sp. ERC-38]
MSPEELQEAILKIPEGYSEVFYDSRKYGISKTVFNQHKSLKVYAQELGGSNFISFNYYLLQSKQVLKPCEMPENKVIHFLENLSYLK